MNVRVEIVNAFVDSGQGGNPAGVVFDADTLSKDQKLAIARAVGYSETAFVSRSAVAAVKLEFFTPERQIAHCGHATIATFSRMRQLGLVSDGKMSKETIDGIREIIVDGDLAFMEQKAPRYTDIKKDSALFKRVLESLGLVSLPGMSELSVVNTGNSFLLVQLQNAAAVAAVEPNQKQIAVISEELDLIGYYVFSTEASSSRHAGARMFAPRYGIDEESATGMAAGPLACYLYDKLGLRNAPLFIEQGRLMKPASPSVIQVNLFVTEGAITGLMAGGRGTSMRTIDLEI